MTIFDKIFYKEDTEKARELKEEALELCNNYNAKDALELLSQSIRYNKNDATVYFLKGWCYRYLKEYDKALSHYDIAIKMKEKSIYYYERGMTFKEAGNLDEALNDLDKAIELEPHRPEPYRARAFLYNDLNKKQEAINNWDKVIELNPEDFDAYSYRGYYKAHLGGDLNSAIEDISKAISADSNKSIYFFHRGFAYIMMRAFVSARKDMEKASELGDTSALGVLKDFEDGTLVVEDGCLLINEAKQKQDKQKLNDELVEALKQVMPNWYGK